MKTRRILAAIMALAMVASILSVSAFAAEEGGLSDTGEEPGAEGSPAVGENVYKVFIGEMGYASIEDALAAAQDGDTVTLLADAEITEAVEFKKAITIDLSGNTLDMTAEPNTSGFYPELRKCSYYINAGVTFKNGTINVTNSEQKAAHGVFFVEVRDSLTFDNVSLNSDGFNAFAFIQSYGGVSFINETAVNIKNNGEGSFVYSEEQLADITVTESEITAYNLSSGIVNSGVTVSGSVITMTDLTDNAMRSVPGIIDSSVITVDGAEYGIKNKDFYGLLTVTDSAIKVRNTQNEDSENAGICIMSMELLENNNSVIDSSMCIHGVEIYYLLRFDTGDGSEIAAVSALKGTELDLSEYTPELSDYSFGGWYADAELEEAVTSITLDADITVYAKWIKNSKGGGLSAGGDTSRTGEDELTVKDEDENTDTDNEDNTDVTAPTGRSMPFADVAEGDWYFENVKYAYDNGLMNGTASDAFLPNGGVTRAMLVTVLWRAEGSPAVGDDADIVPFADVADGMYYTAAVAWAQANGIVLGYSETEFAPDKLIIREQKAAIMHRYAAYKGYDVSAAESADISAFADYDSISEYAIPSLRYAIGTGLINGKTATEIAPTDTATRAEIAAILQRFIEINK